MCPKTLHFPRFSSAAGLRFGRMTLAQHAFALGSLALQRTLKSEAICVQRVQEACSLRRPSSRTTSAGRQYLKSRSHDITQDDELHERSLHRMTLFS